MLKRKQETPKEAEFYFDAEVKFDRTSATYKPEEFISGSIRFIKTKGPAAYSAEISSLSIKMYGQATIHNRHNKKVIEDLRNIAEKIVFIDTTSEVASDKTITNEGSIPFKLKLSKGENKLIETYTGVYINVAYSLTVEAKFREAQIDPVKLQVPFYVQVPNAGRELIADFTYPKPKYFMFRNEHLRGDVQPHHKFKIRGELESEIVLFSDYLAGKIAIDVCESPIRSIDLQMLRNERIESSGLSFREVTEIQMIQLCDGDVTRNLELPIYMILPRYYSCPSVSYKWLTVTFEVNLIVGFKDGYKVTANLPLKIIRN